jgi:hypothetical protein
MAIPKILISDDEVRNKTPHPETFVACARLFRAHGCLQIDNALRPSLVRRLHDAYVRRYSRYFVETEHADALRVGEGRHMITVDVEPPFHTPALYANPFILPVLVEALGAGVVLNSFGSVVSIPGAPAQNVHRDHPPLFDEHAADLFAPPFAVTVIVPLVRLDERAGTTRMAPGSHALFDDKGLARPRFDPVVPVGSCLLMDYRLIHQGTENRSDAVRPIFYVVYSRPWFTDYMNYAKQDPLVMRASVHARTPAKWRSLFAHAKLVDD